MLYGVWFVVYVVCCVMYGMRRTVYDVLYAVYVTLFMLYGVWCIVYYAFRMMYGV